MAEHKQKLWHVVDDCLNPLAAKLFEFAGKLQFRPHFDDVTPGATDLRMLYEEHCIDRAVVYLKATISVDFAEDFTRTLSSARSRFFALDFKASQILNGDIGKPSTVMIRRAIPRLIDMYYEQLHAAYPDQDEQPTGDELPDDLRKMEVEILDEYSNVACEFRDVSNYLRNVAAIVRGKRRLIPEAATPPKDHEASAPYACPGFYKLFFSGSGTPQTVLEIEKLIVATGLTVEQKLREIDEIHKIPPTTSSRDVAIAFVVSHAAVVRTKWWQENRAGAKPEKMQVRNKALREKGKRVAVETKTKIGDVRERPGFGRGKNLPPE